MGKWSRFLLVALVTLAADQASKITIWNHLQVVRRAEVIPHFFDLSLAMNTGVAFGMFSGEAHGYRVAALLAMNLLALGVIFYFLVTSGREERFFHWGLALVAGGAVGNAVDRIRLGAVIDFLEFYVGGYHWPNFNVADIGISVGTGLVFLHLWFTRHD
jgi:signal peptidase II